VNHGNALWGAVPLLPAFRILGSLSPIALFLQYLAIIWLLGFVGILVRSRFGLRVVVLALASAWLPALAQTLRRLYAILTATVERPDGTGSPLAFVMGLAIEQIFWFLPVSALLVYAVVFAHKHRRTRPP
jgi:hypothetical protein